MLLFCNADEDQLHNVKAILLYLEAVLGLRVNFFKSEVICIKVNEDIGWPISLDATLVAFFPLIWPSFDGRTK